jgi:hypothetical protein
MAGALYDEDRCYNLRWKGLYVHTPGVSEEQSEDHIYWCHLTQQCLGPDGKAVDDYECNEARKCYRPA